MNKTSLACSFVIFFLAVTTASAQPYSVAWQTQFGQTGFGVATDPSNNVFIAGGTDVSLSGNPYLGGGDAFLRKYNSTGTVLWTRQIGGSGPDVGNAVTTDAFGNSYIAGYTALTVGGGFNGPFNGTQGSFVSKYDAAGNLLWTGSPNLAGNDTANGVVIDPSGNVVISGYAQQTIGMIPFLNVSLVSKFDAAGNLLWSKKLDETQFSDSSSVKTDSLGNILVAGRTNSGAYLKKLDSAGNLVWSKDFNSGTAAGGPDRANGLVIDSNNNCYLTGVYINVTATDPFFEATTDGYLMKLDSNGTPLWTRQFGSANGGFGNGVALDGTGNPVVTGVLNNSPDGFTNQGNAYVGKFSAAGDLLWSTAFDSSTVDQGFAVAVDGPGSIYAAGYTEGNLTGVSPSGGDAFLIKLSAVPEPATMMLVAAAGWIVAAMRGRR